MRLRDGGIILIIVALALVIGAAIFAVHDPGDKTGFYQADGQPKGGDPMEPNTPPRGPGNPPPGR